MRDGDVLLHHPFDSFSPVASFFQQAARDPQVVAIKATLYRVGPNSPIVASLLEAAQNEVEVTVLVELKVRRRSTTEGVRQLTTHRSGAIRREKQHHLGQNARVRWRTRCVRREEPQDPRQAGAGHSARDHFRRRHASSPLLSHEVRSSFVESLSLDVIFKQHGQLQP